MLDVNAQLIKRFTVYLRAERGASENTIASYEFDLARFAEWWSDPFVLVKRTDLQRYISDFLASGKSARTARRHIACLRTLYRFLVDEDEISYNPTRNLPIPKSWKRVPKTIGREDLEKMVQQPVHRKLLGIRDKAILLTFFGSGLRETELAQLKVHDIDLDAGIAKVWNGKGGKDGIVPLSPRAVVALKTYLETVRPIFANRDSGSHLFLGQQGALTRQAVYHRVRDIARAALGKQVSPHQLRHGFATVLVEGGADIRDVQALMRHSDVDTTQIYVHIDLTYLRRIYYASHPRARIATA